MDSAVMHLNQPMAIFVSKVFNSSSDLSSGFFQNEYPYFWIRIAGVFITGLILSLIFGKYSIALFSKLQVGQVVRSEGPKRHYSKSGTPTMGGVGILLAFSLSILLWGDWHSINMWLVLSGLLFFGFIGFLDDFIKIHLKNTSGLRAKWKYLCQSVLAIALILIGHYFKVLPDKIYIPFFSDANLNHNLSINFFWICFWQYIVIVGASNAVNLTDGLDGLVIIPVILVCVGLAILAYIQSHVGLANLVDLPYFINGREMVIVLIALIGACIGFLWFNSYPAQIFMGDVGALALGAALGLCALMLAQEIIFAVMGFVFVIEALSVIIQVASYKIRKKRVFLMAPIHHHFELKGWEEPKICVRFWLLSLVFLVLGLFVLL